MTTSDASGRMDADEVDARVLEAWGRQPEQIAASQSFNARFG